MQLEPIVILIFVCGCIAYRLICLIQSIVDKLKPEAITSIILEIIKKVKVPVVYKFLKKIREIIFRGFSSIFKEL